MDENNQIEGMAKVLYGKYCGNDKCGNCKEPSCVSYIFAEKLYNAGYRKQSDTVREFVSKIDEEIQHRTIVNDYSPDFDEMQDIIYQTAKEYGAEVEE